MASATSTESNSPHPYELGSPAPLAFFQRDAIHDDNQSLLSREEQRWRLLSRLERWKLTRYVASLARQLQRGRYNWHVTQREKLRAEILQAKRDYQAEDDMARARARREILAIRDRARPHFETLRALKETYAQFEHYAGWLEYERQHRTELREEARREKKIRREMRREAGWLEALLIDVFRTTKGCHHITVDKDSGKERTRTPKFERSVITPDAHWFYLAASRRALFGWRWKLPYGVTITRLTDEEVIANMRAATKRQVDAIWSNTGQLMFRVSRLDSPDALPKEVKWRDAMRYFPKAKQHRLPYTIGVSENRKFQWFDLVSDPHILVAGKSQSGKSNLVNGIIGTLVSTHTPDELRVVLVDQKGGIEFTHWYELPHLLYDIVKTVDEVQPMLTRLVALMRGRMARLERTKKKDIAAYNTAVDVEHRLARVVVVIDEMNTFVGLGTQTEEIHNLIMLLASQGRAVGVHVITATQHPEVKVIPSRIKTNMSMRLSGAMPTISASMIVLDGPEAARIPNIPGRFVAVIGLQTLTVQVPRVFDEDIAAVVSSTRRQYPDVTENLSDFAEQPKLVVWDEQRVLVSILDWLQGQISADKLHATLGSDSPGERELRRLSKRITEEVRAVGYIRREDNGTEWVIKPDRNRKFLIPRTGNSHNSDKVTVTETEAIASELASEQEIAAD